MHLLAIKEACPLTIQQFTPVQLHQRGSYCYLHYKGGVRTDRRQRMEQDWRYSMACPTDTQLIWLGSLKYGWSTVSSKCPPVQAITPRRMSHTQLGGVPFNLVDTLKKAVEDVEKSLLVEELRQLTLIKKHRELIAKQCGTGVSSCILCGVDFYMFTLCWIMRVTSCPSECHDCKNKVCSKCKRQYTLKNGQVTLCAVCHSRREIWKNTGAWYLGHHPAFDMSDEELAAKLRHLQTELLTEEDSSPGNAKQGNTGLNITLRKSSTVGEFFVQPPTPLIELNGIDQLLEIRTSRSPSPAPEPGNLFAFKRQMSRSLPSLTSTIELDLAHPADGKEAHYDRHNSYVSFADHKSLTIPQAKRRSSWLEGSDVTLQDIFRSRELGLPRSVARLVRQTPSRGSPVSSRGSIASISDTPDTEHSSHEEGVEDKEESPAGSPRNSLHDSSLDESESEQVPVPSLPQHLVDAQERRRSYGKSKANSLNKFVKKAEDLIKSISSATSVPSREPSPDSNGNIQFTMSYDRDSKELRVTILRCQGLRAADSNGLSDPYVTVYLSEGSTTKQTTAVVERTLNPVFNQEFVYYGISDSFVRRHELIFIVYDRDIMSKDDFLGSATIPIRRVSHDVDTFCLSLTDQQPGNVGTYSEENSQALVSIGYSLERRSITVGVQRVVRLRPASKKKQSANPYAKIILSNIDGEVSKKTAVHHQTLNPEFKEEFEFSLEGMRLDKMGLRLGVSHKSRATNRTTHLCEASLDGLLYQALTSKDTRVQEWIELTRSKH